MSGRSGETKKATLIDVQNWEYLSFHVPPKTMKIKGFGHLKTTLFTIETSKDVGFLGPMVYISLGTVCYFGPPQCR